MPIKFRCQHCKQLLGIAHSKAGSLVDCPTCGRTLRVPNLDGSIDPPPPLGMNLADDDLRNALDELGQIGREQPNSIGNETPATKETAGTQATPGPQPSRPNPDEISLTSAAPDAMEVHALESKPSAANQRGSWTEGVAQRVVAENQSPVAVSRAEPVVLGPLPSAVVIDPPQHGSANQPGTSASASPSATQQGALQHEILAGLADQSPAKSRPQSQLEIKSPPNQQENVLHGISRSMAAGIAAACFLFGIMTGFGIGRLKPVPQSPEPARVAGAAVEPHADDAQEFGDAKSTPRLNGQLTYLNDQGNIVPDVGARILAIPELPRKQSKLPSVGFRPADDAESRDTAHQALLELGGSEATADARGRYALPLSDAGAFHLVVLSRFRGRQPNSNWPKAAEQILRARFERPEQLVGNLAFHVETIQHDSSGIEIWNHVSERD